MFNWLRKLFGAKKLKPPYEQKQVYDQYLPDKAGCYYWVTSKNAKYDKFDDQSIEVVYLQNEDGYGVLRIGDMTRYPREDFIWLSYCFSMPKELKAVVEDLRNNKS